jgi:hypothetical protein
MEEVLDLVAEPSDPRRPVVCVDELPYALRDHGIRFVSDSLPGLGTRYRPADHPHDRMMRVLDLPRAAPAPGDAVARAIVRDGISHRGETRRVVLTLAPRP